MLDAVRKFATKVLLLHFLLLMVVIAIVVCASRSVYVSARQQAIRQSSERLELLAQQTSRGIENYYVSIMADLDALLRDEAATQPAPDRAPPPRPDLPPNPDRNPALATSGNSPPPRPPNPRQNLRLTFRQIGEGRSVPASPQLTGIMWRQLRGRVANLFLVDNDRATVLAAFPASSQTFADEITKQQLDWFKTLKVASMSHIQPPAADAKIGGYHLIAIPATLPRGGARGGGGIGGLGGIFGGGGGGGGGGAPGGNPPDVTASGTVVAVVPIQTVKESFFDPLNAQGVVNAALLDEFGNALVSIDSKITGTNVLNGMDPQLREKMQPFVSGSESGSLVLDQPYRINSETLPPRILAFEQTQGLPGRRWTVLASSPLADAQALVDNVFRDALFWAVFVTLSITALMISTSVFMIRSRMKFERARHDVLTRELQQARQIQLAWLPDSKNIPLGLEVSAANLPASHISGDFYNWFHLPDIGHSRQSDAHDHPPTASSKVAIVIGDVTGHGMAAAFLMATTQLLVRTTLSRYQDPGRCLQEVNRQLCTQGFQGQFVTMLVIILDPTTSSIEIATAGHPSPLVERDGKFESLTMVPQLVLGVDPTEHYKSEGFILEPGASILLYTDGVVEAVSESGEQYGVNRLIQSLNTTKTGTTAADPHARITSVLDNVKHFCHNHDLLDDITLVALRTTPATVQLSAQLAVS